MILLPVEAGLWDPVQDFKIVLSLSMDPRVPNASCKQAFSKAAQARFSCQQRAGDDHLMCNAQELRKVDLIQKCDEVNKSQLQTNQTNKQTNKRLHTDTLLHAVEAKGFCYGLQADFEAITIMFGLSEVSSEAMVKA